MVTAAVCNPLTPTYDVNRLIIKESQSSLTIIMVYYNQRAVLPVTGLWYILVPFRCTETGNQQNDFLTSAYYSSDYIGPQRRI